MQTSSYPFQDVINNGRLIVSRHFENLTIDKIEEQTPEWCLKKLKEVDSDIQGNTEATTYLNLHKIEENHLLILTLGARAQGALTRPEYVNRILQGMVLEQIDRLGGEYLPWLTDVTKATIEMFKDNKLLPSITKKTTLYPKSYFSILMPTLFNKIAELGGSLQFAWKQNKANQ